MQTKPPAGVRPHGDLVGFYNDGADRARFVSRLFDNTACHYDRISAALSFGTCKRYRKMALGRSGLKPGMRVLDVATGTGLTAQAALELGIAPNQIVGLDVSRGMLEQNQKRLSIGLTQARAETLPFADGTFDFVCMGYALRHVEELGMLFREFHRVLKPGGKVLILEISRPESRIMRFFAALYLNWILPFIVRITTRQADAAQLLKFYWATIDSCVPPKTILQVLSESGLKDVKRATMSSLLNDYSAVKLA